jgi:branched-chain amino acid transport system substrate-binding protein
MPIIKYISFLSFSLAVNFAIAAEVKPIILIGLTAEFGIKDSLSAQSIEKGILLAIDEINTGGGVLGGNQFKLVSRDDRGVPARGQDNLRELAAYPNMLAVFSGRFSPVTMEIAPIANQLKILLLAPWSAADSITKYPYPNYVFRLSLTDSWAVNVMHVNTIIKNWLYFYRILHGAEVVSKPCWRIKKKINTFSMLPLNIIGGKQTSGRR